MRINGLDIPENNREIALHLNNIKGEVTNIKGEVTNINNRLDNLETSIENRRFRFQDIMLSSLLLPLVGGMLLFLLTKTLG